MATQVALSNLDNWLQTQPENTASTPYELEITGITSDNRNSIKTALGNNLNKYVDLSYTTFPETVYNLSSCFYNCTNLVKSPILPKRLTNSDGIR